MPEKIRVMAIRPGKRFARMGFAPPLGLLSMIAVLRREFPDRFEFELVEQALYDLSVDDIEKRMRDFNPQLVFMSCMSVEGNELRELCSLSRRTLPDVPVWIGGPHASVFFDWELKTGNVDAVCIGEGELAIIEMVRSWMEGKPLDDVAGLALVRDGEIVKTAERGPIEDLDWLPLPAWDLIDFDKYALQISMNGFVHSMPWSIIMTTRACPFQCIYCHCIFGKKVRKRSVEHVMAELDLLVNTYGIKEMHIVDDIFNLDLPRAKAICDEIVERGFDIKIAFPNGLRGDRMDRELIQKLKKAGCYCITYAVETASPRIQKQIKKNLDLEKVKEVIAWTDEEGLITQAFFMLGFPGETKEEMQQTIDYALDSRVLRAWFFTVVVYPRTGLYDMAQEVYPDFDFSGWDYFNLRYWAEETFYSRVEGVDLFKVQRDAYRAFFLRPSIIARIFIRLPKNKWFVRGIYWGLRSVINTLTSMETYFRPIRKWLGDHVGILKE